VAEQWRAMLADYAAVASRQYEALRLYDEIRRRLSDELGLDPCAELPEAHAQVLTQAADR
jgi:DNA-binding SARP family transcriptional activator